MGEGSSLDHAEPEQKHQDEDRDQQDEDDVHATRVAFTTKRSVHVFDVTMR